jgi:cytochrome c
MQDHKNTIAGWVLFAGIIVLGASIVTGEVFHSERPEKMGYPIEGVVLEGEGGAEAAKPIDFSIADATKGEQVFKKCAACHNADKGGANALGPNLWGVLGKPHGHVAGFAYSDALKGKPGSWDFASLSDWLANPKKYAPGTKMTFAGLSNPQDRADVIAFLNAHSDAPQPLPAAPAAAAPAAGAPAADAKAGEKAAAETAIGGGAEKAPNVPVKNQVDAEKGGAKTSGGDAAKVAQ